MQKWEYSTRKLSTIANYSPENDDNGWQLGWRLTDKFGKEGWDLVSVDNDIGYFKRPVIEPNHMHEVG